MSRIMLLLAVADHGDDDGDDDVVGKWLYAACPDSVSLCLCLCASVSLVVSVCLRLCLSACLCLCLSESRSLSVYVSLCVCMSWCLCVSICVPTCACLCACVCVCGHRGASDPAASIACTQCTQHQVDLRCNSSLAFVLTMAPELVPAVACRHSMTKTSSSRSYLNCSTTSAAYRSTT